MQTFELYIPTMVCPACVAPEKVLSDCEPVKKVTVNYLAHTVTIETELLGDAEENFIQQIYSALEDVGYPCEGFLETTPCLDEDDEENDARREEFELTKQRLADKDIRNHWIKGSVGTLFGAVILILSLVSVGLPVWGIPLEGGISTLLTLYFGKETYQQAFVSLVRNKTFSMDWLFTVSTLLALVTSFIPGFSPMFDVPLLILGFKHIGKAIEETAKQRFVEQSFRAYADREVLSELALGVERVIAVKNLRPGNVILLRSGKTLPVDGVCLTQQATIYNTIVTGKTVPQDITENDMLLAGCIVPDEVDCIRIRVVNKEVNSYLALLDKRTKAAELEKSATEDTATKRLKYFLRVVFALAGIAGMTVFFVISPSAGAETTIAILVSACPCTLGLITPLAMKAGIKKAADLGIIFKGGKSIEAAADIDAIAFDLTGTLTSGNHKVIYPLTMPSDVLSILIKVETGSTHPIARAICDYANAQNSLNKEYKEVQIDRSHHAGVVATLDKDTIIVGNRALMKEKGIAVAFYDAEIKKINAEHVIYIAKNNIVVNYLLLEDPLRNDAVSAIQGLKKQGIKNFYIITGTDYLTASKIAQKLNIPAQNIYADCKGESTVSAGNTKAEHMRNLIAQGLRIAMVGDGDNDAMALATSRCGFGINTRYGRGGAQQNSHVIINQDSLWSIVNALVIAKQTINNIKQNLWMSAIYNLSSPLIFSGILRAVNVVINPAFGAAFMDLQTAFILMNVERFKRQPVPAVSVTARELSPAVKAPFQSTKATLKKKFNLGLQQALRSSSVPTEKHSLNTRMTHQYNSLIERDTELGLSTSFKRGP